MNLEEALDQQVGELRYELGELRQLLHESHERESLAAGEAETARREAIGLRKELETLQGRGLGSPKVERLREEVKRLELQLLERSLEQDFVQAKIELEVHRAVESERRKWEEEKLAEDRQRLVASVPSNHEQLRPNEHSYSCGKC